MNEPLKAPFPWYGGKSRVAPIVWERFGHVKNYVEPFFGSGAVLLGKPDHIKCIETINDKDAYVSNFWRAIKHDPDEVAKWADNPVNENDLHARHCWLIARKSELQSQIEDDPDYFDSRIAGYWVFGISCWIGNDFCSGKKLRRLPHVSSHDKGTGIHRQRIYCSCNSAGMGINRTNVNLKIWFDSLSERLRRVRVCSGDWTRLMKAASIGKGILSGIFLDPPYSEKANRYKNIYNEDDLYVGNEVFEWAIQNGDNSFLRIALCGYEGEYNLPDNWNKYEWKANSGMSGKNNTNRIRERIWFSPHCLKGQKQLSLFEKCG